MCLQELADPGECFASHRRFVVTKLVQEGLKKQTYNYYIKQRMTKQSLMSLCVCLCAIIIMINFHLASGQDNYHDYSQFVCVHISY